MTVKETIINTFRDEVVNCMNMLLVQPIYGILFVLLALPLRIASSTQLLKFSEGGGSCFFSLSILYDYYSFTSLIENTK